MRLALLALVFAAAALIGSECAPSAKQLIKLRAGSGSPLVIDVQSDVEVDWFSYFGGLHWYTEVELGTPGQKVNLLLNLYLDDNWAFSKDCANTGCKGHKTFDLKASSTAGPKIGKRYIPFLGGDLVGNTYTDIINLPGVGACKEPISVMDKVPPKVFDNLPFDGQLGLARKDIEDATTYIQSLKNAGVIADTKFAFFTKGGENYFVVGGYPTEDLDGQLTFAGPFVKGGTQWEFMFEGFEIEDKKVQVSGGYAQLFTSMPFIVGAKDNVDTINAGLGAQAIGKTGLYALPSCETNGLPDVSIKVSGRSFAIKPRDYVLKLDNSNKCVSAFAASRIYSGWFIGQPLIGSTMITFDVESGKIGLGNVKSS